jgi:hypothetical protein
MPSQSSSTAQFLISNIEFGIVDRTSFTARMYRAYNPNTNCHFFTTNPAEFDNAVAHGFRDETTGQPGFALLSTQMTDAQPLFRLYDPQTGCHKYTTSTLDRDDLSSIGWRYERTEGYVLTGPQNDPSLTAVFRLNNTATGGFLFTLPTERDAILHPPGCVAANPWRRDSDLGFAIQIDPDGQVHLPGPSAVARMYRAYNPNANFHFFTTSRNEFNNAVCHGYIDETTDNPGFALLTAPVANALPLYRLYNLQRGSHYYTLNVTERNTLVNAAPPPWDEPDQRTIGWRDEGVEGYMYAASSDDPSATRIYRLYNTDTGVHLFTDNVTQRKEVLAITYTVTGTHPWRLETDLGFAFAVDSQGNRLPATTGQSSSARSAAAISASDSAETGSDATTESPLPDRLSVAVTLAGRLASESTMSLPRTARTTRVGFEVDSLRYESAPAESRIQRHLVFSKTTASLHDAAWESLADELPELWE